MQIEGIDTRLNFDAAYQAEQARLAAEREEAERLRKESLNRDEEEEEEAEDGG